MDIESGAPKDLSTEGIMDLYATKWWAVKLATDAVITVLKVDQIIMAKQVSVLAVCVCACERRRGLVLACVRGLQDTLHALPSERAACCRPAAPSPAAPTATMTEQQRHQEEDLRLCGPCSCCSCGAGAFAGVWGDTRGRRRVRCESVCASCGNSPGGQLAAS